MNPLIGIGEKFAGRIYTPEGRVLGVRKYLLLFIFVLLAFTLSSCLEAEIDIDLKRDGSGEIRMKVLPLESSMNFLINEVETELRRDEAHKDSVITRGTEPDGRRCLLIRKKFKNVEEADPHCSFTSHKEYDQFVMDIPGDFLGIVKSVRVNMPGQIITSNVGNFSGRSLVWNRTRPSDNKLIVSSKPHLLSLHKEKVLPLIIILGFAIGVVILLTVLNKIKRRKITREEINFCPECGTKLLSDGNFCPNCGQNLK